MKPIKLTDNTITLSTQLSNVEITKSDIINPSKLQPPSESYFENENNINTVYLCRICPLITFPM